MKLTYAIPTALRAHANKIISGIENKKIIIDPTRATLAYPQNDYYVHSHTCRPGNQYLYIDLIGETQPNLEPVTVAVERSKDLQNLQSITLNTETKLVTFTYKNGDTADWQYKKAENYAPAPTQGQYDLPAVLHRENIKPAQRKEIAAWVGATKDNFENSHYALNAVWIKNSTQTGTLTIDSSNGYLSLIEALPSSFNSNYETSIPPLFVRYGFTAPHLTDLKLTPPAIFATIKSTEGEYRISSYTWSTADSRDSTFTDVYYTPEIEDAEHESPLLIDVPNAAELIATIDKSASTIEYPESVPHKIPCISFNPAKKKLQAYSSYDRHDTVLGDVIEYEADQTYGYSFENLEEAYRFTAKTFQNALRPFGEGPVRIILAKRLASRPLSRRGMNFVPLEDSKPVGGSNPWRGKYSFLLPNNR